MPSVASRDEIIALQTRPPRLDAGGTPTTTVAHYRKAFDKGRCQASGFSATVGSSVTFHSRPKNRPGRENYPFNMFAVPREKLVRVHGLLRHHPASPIVVGYTRADIDMWSDVMGALDPRRGWPHRP